MISRNSLSRGINEVPLYEYQCKACGHVFEREHPIGEAKKYKCPECASSRTQKIISQVGVIFKGSGFYVTDNRKSSVGKKSGLKTTPKSPNGNGSATDSTEDSESVTQPTPASEN